MDDLIARASRSVCVEGSAEVDVEGHASAVVLRLEEALTARGVPSSQVRSTIARTCGVTYQSVYHWFIGRTKMPRADYLARLALVYNIDLAWLILGDGDAAAFSARTPEQS